MVATESIGFDAAVIRRLGAAHVVVVSDTCGTEVFHGIDLAIEEQREEAIPDDDGGLQASILRYYCCICPHGAAELDVWVGTGAMITIVGMYSSGTTFTMVGCGLYDRTEGSTFQIKFEAPPMMTMRRGDEPARAGREWQNRGRHMDHWLKSAWKRLGHTCRHAFPTEPQPFIGVRRTAEEAMDGRLNQCFRR